MTGSAIQLNMDSVIRQTGMAITLSDFTREHCANSTVDVLHRNNEGDFLTTLQCRLTLLNQNVIQRAIQTMVLSQDLITWHVFSHRRLSKNLTEIQAMNFPVLNTFACIQEINAPNQIIKLTNAELSHDLAHFFSNKEEEVHNVLWLTRELFTQFRVLCSNTNWASI